MYIYMYTHNQLLHLNTINNLHTYIYIYVYLPTTPTRKYNQHLPRIYNQHPTRIYNQHPTLIYIYIHNQRLHVHTINHLHIYIYIYIFIHNQHLHVNTINSTHIYNQQPTCIYIYMYICIYTLKPYT